MNRLNIFVIGLFFAVAVFTGCKKEVFEEEFELECGEFCLYSNVEDFHKTAPIINEYLEYLSKNNLRNDEQKLQALTEWLNSYSCVINAKLEYVGTDKEWAIPPGRYGRIAILLNDNGMTRELTLNIFGEYSKPLRATGYSYLKPKEVSTHLHYYLSGGTTTIRDVFDFINLFDLKALNIYKLGSKGYVSSMPNENFDYIVSNLSAKPYLSSVGGYREEPPIIDVTMNNMENKVYQTDWFKTMNDYKLTEITTIYSWFIVGFEVPDGKEREWIEKFNTYEFVYGATLNYGFQSMLIE